ncbi:MAG: helix-turn-helix domain-containing protein [Flavobacteriales bacterium]|nr:helix-turn-helix domain-containing protein [Flavobacteriales bacterium]
MNGLELYELRKEHNVTQEELAKHLGYFSKGTPNRSMIARFENGHANINQRIKMLVTQYFSNIDKEKENV